MDLSGLMRANHTSCLLYDYSLMICISNVIIQLVDYGTGESDVNQNVGSIPGSGTCVLEQGT